MNRRGFITMILMGGTAVAVTSMGEASSASGNFEVTRTEAEWRSMLTDLQYKVMRQEGTEPAGSSPLDKQYSEGTYHCRGCDLALYPSDTKFDSGTGWPSFYRPLDNAVETKRDFKLIYPRTEVHCRRCGSHLGHIFNDGPQPTGKRHCLNGVSLVFKPA
ncbi:peptide-methionine (R)-S-oxide reductase MsrB [Roseovarius indicus]|uniref:peptide-methionine (R)-S-oxide reductase n=1 Tax=Roseovarius indicus TaxID=540747 RepID=A0A0T5P4Y8_9RHOB|nr:peptide-methionine (R)-S-oxide reductase MsrB [Roseovarius indicus]KRS16213.1 methionine sulfoxide reductase B [Roseovarius indicus]QEW27420.1 Peptide methionine sulfoxide reductase MsrB [Roseovarius indicus]SFD48632.1 peptide-methionine (R)-S-oxide reductase [Roseovarius indicus]